MEEDFKTLTGLFIRQINGALSMGTLYILKYTMHIKMMKLVINYLEDKSIICKCNLHVLNCVSNQQTIIKVLSVFLITLLCKFLLPLINNHIFSTQHRQICNTSSPFLFCTKSLEFSSENKIFFFFQLQILKEISESYFFICFLS